MDERPAPPRIEHPEDLVTFGGQVDRVKVSIRFFGDDLDPAYVTGRLGIEPSAAHRKGDQLPGRYRRIAKQGSWRLEGNDSLPSVEHQLRLLFDVMTSDLSVWSELTSRFQADVFCGIFLEADNRGFSLSPQIVTELSKRGLKIDFDIYGK